MPDRMFRIQFYDASTEAFVGDDFLLPVIPAPRQVYIHAGGSWRVERVSVSIAQRGSMAARQGSPVDVDVIVTSSPGIFGRGYLKPATPPPATEEG